MDYMIAAGAEEDPGEYCAGRHTLHHRRVEKRKRQHCGACDCGNSGVQKTETAKEGQASEHSYGQHQNENGFKVSTGRHLGCSNDKKHNSRDSQRFFNTETV